MAITQGRPPDEVASEGGVLRVPRRGGGGWPLLADRVHGARQGAGVRGRVQGARGAVWGAGGGGGAGLGAGRRLGAGCKARCGVQGSEDPGRGWLGPECGGAASGMQGGR